MARIKIFFFPIYFNNPSHSYVFQSVMPLESGPARTSRNRLILWGPKLYETRVLLRIVLPLKTQTFFLYCLVLVCPPAPLGTMGGGEQEGPCPQQRVSVLDRLRSILSSYSPAAGLPSQPAGATRVLGSPDSLRTPRRSKGSTEDGPNIANQLIFIAFSLYS